MCDAMFIKNFTEENLSQIGIRFEHHAYDKKPKTIIYDAEILLYRIYLTIAQRYHHNIIIRCITCNHYPLAELNLIWFCFIYYSICICLFHVHISASVIQTALVKLLYSRIFLLTIYANVALEQSYHEALLENDRLVSRQEADLKKSNNNNSSSSSKLYVGTSCVLVALFVLFTVKTLYAGTLAAYWTTAPSTSRNCLAQLATLLLLLATLTIAARCYASTNAPHPSQPVLDQYDPKNPSPIHNSKIHSSNLILSRLFPSKFVESDISVIFSNSKRSLHNQNYNKHVAKKRALNLRENTSGYVRHLKYDSRQTFKQIVPVRSEITSRSIDLGRNLNNFDNEPDLKSKTENDLSTLDKINTNYSVEVSGKIDLTRVNSTSSFVKQHQNDSSFQKDGTRKTDLDLYSIVQPMPPAHGHNKDSSVNEWVIVGFVVSAVVLTVALGLVTCVLSHYRTGTAPEGGGTAADPHNAAPTPTSAPMLSVVSAGATAGVGGMDRLRGGRAAARELASSRDRQVRLHTIRTDIAINLPPSIALPDGEEHPYTNSRLHIRDPEQEAEIYQKCIRPPPNRTVFEKESPPPYRSSSAGLLGSSSSNSSCGSSDWSSGSTPLVVRCHSMSSTSKRPDAGTSGQKTDFLQRTVKIFTGKKAHVAQPPSAPTLPVIVVPTSRRRTSTDQHSSSSSTTATSTATTRSSNKSSGV